jgi:quercetin dioxygenase-like cupin family protein
MYNDKKCFLTAEQLTALAVAAVIGIGFVGIAAAHRDTTESELPLSARNIFKDLDGKEATMTVVEMTLEPGQAGTPHSQPGPLFGYVVEGEYELAMDHQRTKVIQVGETFYESTGRLHGVLTNPAGKSKTRILAVVLNPRDSRQVAIKDPMPVERRFGLHAPDRH